MRKLLKQYRGVILLAILAFAFFTRMYRLHIPSNYMFDEVYHAVTAKLISHNDPRAYEWWNPVPEPNTAVDWLHPPLAKYFQAGSMLAFGENSFGWRFSSVVFGVLVIMMVYHLAYVLFDDPAVALLAAAIASLDGLLLVMSRIAMNDIHVTFFILLTLYWYLTFRKTQQFKDLLITGIAGGLALSSKWSGLFALVLVIGFETHEYIVSALNFSTIDIKKFFSNFIKVWSHFLLTRVTILGLLPFAIYVASYTQMFMQGKDWAHFQELHRQIWWYQTHLDAHHPYESRPVQWFFDLKPVWIYVNYSADGTRRSDVYAFGNPVLFWIGAAVVVFSILFLFTHRRNLRPSKTKSLKKSETITGLVTTTLQHPLTFLLVAYLMVWLPWQLSPRIMFFYHYTPAVPLLSILIAYWVNDWADTSKKLSYAIMIAIAVTFVVWYPHWTGINVPNKFADEVYFILDEWR